MDISVLAAKQKRLKDWTLFLESEVTDPKMRERIEQALRSFANTLFRCWDKGAIDQADAEQLGDLERILEQLNEEARLIGVRPLGAAKTSQL
ncbi:MAG: hypothetical protein K1X83_07620 [Oligoflexia bacterium]|nr:hypothetical protein [Oligoflexia bacterium]